MLPNLATLAVSPGNVLVRCPQCASLFRKASPTGCDTCGKRKREEEEKEECACEEECACDEEEDASGPGFLAGVTGDEQDAPFTAGVTGEEEEAPFTSLGGDNDEEEKSEEEEESEEEEIDPREGEMSDYYSMVMEGVRDDQSRRWG